MSGITYIDYYIPKEELSIANFLENIDMASIPKNFNGKQEYGEFAASVLNLKSIRIESRLDEAEMIGGLIERLFDTREVKPEDIDVMILAQEKSPHQKVNLPQFLQHKYKMSKAYIVTASGNYCANVEVALNIADLLVKGSDRLKNILIVSFLKVENMEKRVFATYGIVGDAAGIMLLNSDRGKIKLIDNEIISRGMLYNVDLNKDNSLIHSKYYAKCIVDLMKKNSLNNNNIKRVIIQNANPLMISQILDSRGLGSGKIFTANIGKYGHMDCLDFLINLKDLTDNETFNKDDFILAFGTGYAGTYISSLFSTG
jgi:3-oxoacyl-[acyl-carrier-protein] synthase III